MVDFDTFKKMPVAFFQVQHSSLSRSAVMLPQPSNLRSSSNNHGPLIARQSELLQETLSSLRALSLKFDLISECNEVLRARLESADVARQHDMVEIARQQSRTNALVEVVLDAQRREEAMNLKIKALEDRATEDGLLIEKMAQEHCLFVAAVKQNWGQGAILTFYPVRVSPPHVVCIDS